MIWEATQHCRWNVLDVLGYIPQMVSEGDPRPAREQFHDNYAHGGGWSPIGRWTFNPNDQSIKYPGDERLLPLAVAKLRDETIYVYESAWVCIVQPNGAFEVARMD